jgi:hypothetical protein
MKRTIRVITKLKKRKLFIKKILKKHSNINTTYVFGGEGIEGLQCTLQLV